MGSRKCIDISHHEGSPDFQAVAESGILAVIHKATEGTTYIDPLRANNLARAKQQGLAICTYHFLKHGNATEQMEFYCKIVQPGVGERVIIDHEDAACTLGDLHEAVLALRNISNERFLNLKITVYSGHLLKEQLDDAYDPLLATGTDLWIAHYTSGAPTWPYATYPSYKLWQYSETGHVPGIEDEVDMNEFNGSDRELIEWIGPGVPPTQAKPEWEYVCVDSLVSASEGDYLERIKVQGGWLYRSRWLYRSTSAMAMSFVPE